VLNSQNKLQPMLTKNKIFSKKRKTTEFWQKNTAKTQHFGKIMGFTAFNENYSFHDFRVSMIF